MSNQLSELVLEDEDFVSYINNQKVKSINIIFNEGEDDISPIIFEHEIEA